MPGQKPDKDIDAEQLKLKVAELIVAEQGSVPFGLAVAKHLSMVPAETAWKVFQFVVQERGSLFNDEHGLADERALRAFSEGLLCGLRIRSAIGTLSRQSAS